MSKESVQKLVNHLTHNTDRRLDLRAAPRDHLGYIEVGEGDNHVTPRAAPGNVQSNSVPSFAVDVKREILVALKNAMGQPMTRADIAKAVNRKKTPWLSGHVEQLVEAGYVIREAGVWKNGCTMYWYSIPLKGSLQ